jgi:hypothetical protein
MKKNKTELIVHGQGVFIFDTKNKPTTNTDTSSSCSFVLSSQDATTKLKVVFTQSSVSVINLETDEPYIDPLNKCGLSPLDGAYYWFSLDSQNQRFYAGVGEARIETALYIYQLSQTKGNKLSLETLKIIDSSESEIPILPMRVLRDPIKQSVPLLIKHVDKITMNDVAKGNSMHSPNLNKISQQLYGCISGKKFVLDDDDFPEFSDAIEHSIKTPGLWCYERLKQKSTEFNKDKPNIKETYLRITLGQNNGESPGIPYVMEIWPVGHYSPIHNHGSANAIIRVLHGSIHVKLFPFLCDQGIKEFGSADFKKDDITWISESLNQVHQLVNLETNTQTCITIQCYTYNKSDKDHYDYFDYITDDKHIAQYEPDSDSDFIDFKKLMKKEWMQQKSLKKTQSPTQSLQLFFNDLRQKLSVKK